MPILTDGACGHVEKFIIAFCELIVKEAYTLMDIVGFELPHNVRASDGAVNVGNDHLLILLP